MSIIASTSTSSAPNTYYETEEQLLEKVNEINDILHLFRRLVQGSIPIDLEAVGFTLYKGGKHAGIVFEEETLPGIIFKLCYPNARKLAVDASRKAIQEHQLKYCHVPPAIIVSGCLVMGKAAGVTGVKARLLCEEEFKKFGDERIKSVWRRFFKDAAEFIAATRLTDITWANVGVDPERGITFFDIEFPVTEMEELEKFKDIKIGLEGLMNLAHPDFFDDIIAAARKHGVAEKIDAENLRLQRIRRLEMSERVRKWHQERNITPASRELIAERHWSGGLWHGHCLQNLIIEQLNAKIKDERGMKENANDLEFQRSYQCQPYREFSGRSIAEWIAKLRESEHFGVGPTGRPAVESALKELQESGLICAWEENLTSNILVIYF